MRLSATTAARPCGDSTACPRANCFTERSVLTAKTELADHILIFGEQHLRTVLAQYGALWAPRTVTRPLITEFAAGSTDLAVTVRRPGSEQEDRRQATSTGGRLEHCRP